MSVIDYHLKELETAKSLDDPRRIMPEFGPQDQTILDIGCGIGQTFVASDLHDDDSRRLIGLDVDQEALAYGRQNYEGISFLRGTADSLPLSDGVVDRVVSRVSLPYTDIPAALCEIHRVLKPGGSIWLTLHPLSMAVQHLGTSAKRFRVKDVIYRSYVILNGLLFHLSGRLITFPVNGRMESVQTSKAIEHALKEAGFEEVIIERGRHFLVKATKVLSTP